MSRTREDGSPADDTELARLNTELAALAEGAADAQEFLGQLASALFPDAPPELAQITWAERREAPPLARTEPRHAEERLRAAEVRYRTLVEQIPAVTFMAVLGEGENEVYVSPHIEALLGFTQQEWLENPFLWYSQLHPDDRVLWNDEFARGCRTGGPFRAECRFLARDGRIVWVRGEARVVRDAVGRPLFLQGVAFDITESKRAQTLLVREAVRTTEERYRDLVEGLGAVVWEAAPSPFAFTLVSRHAEELLGFPPERWVGDPDFWPSRIHPDDFDAIAGGWEMAIREGNDHTFEYRAAAADGRVVWLQDKMRILRDGEGNAQHIIGVMLDITGRKRAEDERAQLLVREREARSEAETLHRVERLLAAELDFERLVQTITDAGTDVCGAKFGAFFYNVTDADGESYMLYALSGAPREAFDRFPQPRNTPVFEPTFRGKGVVRSDDITHDPRYGTVAPHHGLPAGHLPVRSYLAIPVVSRSGVVLGGLFFGHPEPGRFTERHERMVGGLAAQAAVAMDNARLYEAAERARQAAEQANRAKDEFLATMSHELRTPLNAVLGWTRMLRGSHLDAATRVRALETIERNAQAQAQLVDDILDVSRIITGKLRLDVRPVDLAEVIEGARDVVSHAAHSKGITLETAVDPTAWVMGDPHRLQQVVWNLLSNGIKFTPPGGRVSVRLERAERMARIIVQDTGAGIPREFLPYVFDRFRQADSSPTRTHGGLGLGLAIVRHIVEQHGGKVLADSAGPGRGATFTAEIPLSPASSGDGAAGGTSPRDNAKRSLHGLTVLVVDDEPDARDLIKVILEGYGAAVVVAASAAEAFAAIDRVHPSLIVSDIGMPGTDGYAMIRELRSRGIRIPAVAVTAYGRDQDRLHAIRSGFQHFVSKPLDPLAFLEVITTLRARSVEQDVN